MIETDNHIEIDAPPKERSILVLQGRPLPMAAIESMKAALEEAFAQDRWPVILNYNGPVYWVPVGQPEVEA